MPWGSKLVPILLIALSVSPGVCLGHGAHEAEPVELRGELLDLACYVVHGARGRDNAVCAGEHPTPDQPLALLTGEGELYLLYADHRSAFAYDACRQRVGEQALLAGVPSEREGLRVLEVRDIRRPSPGSREE